MCLLTETHLGERDVFRFANFVCHRTDRPTDGGGTAILVRRGIDHYAVPVLGLTQLCFQGGGCEDHYSALKMNVANSFESLVVSYQKGH
jgi:hypothetical protein